MGGTIGVFGRVVIRLLAFINHFSNALDSSRNLPAISPGVCFAMSFYKSMCRGRLASDAGRHWRGLGGGGGSLAMCHRNPEGHESFPNGSFQSSCKVPFPQPKITKINNRSTIKKFKYILNHLIINHVQLVSGVFCAAVWSPWRHHQHHSSELMSSGCVLSAHSAASPCSPSGLMLLGRTPTSEDFLPFPAGNWWKAGSSPVMHLPGLCRAVWVQGLAGRYPMPIPRHSDWACLLGLQAEGPHICQVKSRSIFRQCCFKSVA